MINLNKKQQKIVYILLKKNNLSSSQIQEEVAKTEEKASLVTIKRTLAEMVEMKALQVSGSGRATTYVVSGYGRLYFNIDAKQYCSTEPDKRFGGQQFNFDVLLAFQDDIFTQEEKTILDDATNIYKQAINSTSESIQKKEMERLVIELSWKSSRIEGNTYTLLDTEKLLLENKVAVGKTVEETQMILNHKEAFEYVYQNSEKFKTLNKRNLEELHSILVKDLHIDTGLRKKPVGVIGSIYRPLDNIYQITEAVEQLEKVISLVASPYSKAFLALLGIAYIQPFDDGNKRTSRLMANAILLAHGLAPLSYRSIDENDYREALLVFYELNSLISLKKIFVEQYEFAAKNYTVG